MPNITEILPDEVLGIVLNYLDFRSLMAVSETCKKFRLSIFNECDIKKIVKVHMVVGLHGLEKKLEALAASSYNFKCFEIKSEKTLCKLLSAKGMTDRSNEDPSSEKQHLAILRFLENKGSVITDLTLSSRKLDLVAALKACPNLKRLQLKSGNVSSFGKIEAQLLTELTFEQSLITCVKMFSLGTRLRSLCIETLRSIPLQLLPRRASNANEPLQDSNIYWLEKFILKQSNLETLKIADLLNINKMFADINLGGISAKLKTLHVHADCVDLKLLKAKLPLLKELCVTCSGNDVKDILTSCNAKRLILIAKPSHAVPINLTKSTTITELEYAGKDQGLVAIIKPLKSVERIILVGVFFNPGDQDRLHSRTKVKWVTITKTKIEEAPHFFRSNEPKRAASSFKNKLHHEVMHNKLEKIIIQKDEVQWKFEKHDLCNRKDFLNIMSRTLPALGMELQCLKQSL